MLVTTPHTQNSDPDSDGRTSPGTTVGVLGASLLLGSAFFLITVSNTLLDLSVSRTVLSVLVGVVFLGALGTTAANATRTGSIPFSLVPPVTVFLGYLLAVQVEHQLLQTERALPPVQPTALAIDATIAVGSGLLVHVLATAARD